MSYDVNTGSSLAARFQALSLPWKIALGAGTLFLLASAFGGDEAIRLPPGIEEGAKLAGLQIQGEKAMYHEQGIVVTDVAGTWVEVRFGDDEKSLRWFNFDYVAGLKLAAD
jgi:hypothetical protein